MTILFQFIWVRGYLVLSGMFSEAGISGYIKTRGAFHVIVRESVTSTNTVLREMAAEGAPEGVVLIAEGQTAGKGRLGRAFYSPPGRGVYFSLLLRPDISAADATLLTPAAAVSAALAIDEVFGVYTGIKWVNDLFLNGCKVCGILTEATLGAGNGMLESAVLGVGINLTMPDSGFPEEIAGVAAALMGSGAVADSERCRLIAATLDRFWMYYSNLAERAFLDEYRARSVVLGRNISVLSADGRRQARALEIDNDCRLVVMYENNEKATLDSGEVSVGIVNSFNCVIPGSTRDPPDSALLMGLRLGGRNDDTFNS